MVRLRLLLSLLAICFAAESAPLGERTKREAILCYKGKDFNETEEVTGSKCGYSFSSRPDCDGDVILPYNNFTSQAATLKFVTVDGGSIKFQLVECQCEGRLCNGKGQFKECLEKAIENGGSINKEKVTPAELDGIIGCVMDNKTLTYDEFYNSHTTTTTAPPPTTTTPMRSAAADSDALSSKDNVFLVIPAVLVLLLIGGVVVCYCCIKNRRQKVAAEGGENKKQELAKTKDTVTTPTNVSTVSPAKTTVSPADATVTPAKATVSPKSGEDQPKRESNAGSVVKSNVKSVGASTMSTNSELPKDITGLLATVNCIIGKGVEAVVDEFFKARKIIYDTKYDSIEWINFGKKLNSVAGNKKCVVDLNLKHRIIKEYNKTRKGHKEAHYNAHFADKERKVIVGESPLYPNTSDFLLLIYFYEVCAAISVASFNEMEDERRHYVPRQKHKIFGCFTLRNIKSHCITGSLRVNEIEICLNGTRPRKFIAIQLMKNGYDKPEALEHAVLILDYIERHISSKISSKSPILFHCAAGSDRSSSMAMLHMTISACGNQKQAVDYLAIFEDILCARRKSLKSRACLTFMLRVFVEYACHVGVIKAHELGTWRRDVEELMKRVRDDKNERSGSRSRRKKPLEDLTQ